MNGFLSGCSQSTATACSVFTKRRLVLYCLRVVTCKWRIPHTEDKRIARVSAKVCIFHAFLVLMASRFYSTVSWTLKRETLPSLRSEEQVMKGVQPIEDAAPSLRCWQ